MIISFFGMNYPFNPLHNNMPIIHTILDAWSDPIDLQITAFIFLSPKL